MPEPVNETIWPKVEEHLKTALSGDRQKDALAYVAYMKANGISIAPNKDFL